MKQIKPASFAYNFLIPFYDYAYLGVAKCGSSSMRAAFGCKTNYCKAEHRYASRALALTMGTRIAVIREPAARIKSAWQMWQRSNNHPHIPWDEWWPVIRENPMFDLHTAPYTITLGNDATEIYCLERADEWWPTLVERYPETTRHGLGRYNRAKKPLEVPPGTDDEINAVYADDFLLWSSLMDRSTSR